MAQQMTAKQLNKKFIERLNQFVAAKIIDDTGCDTLGQYFHIEFDKEAGEVRFDQYGRVVATAKQTDVGFGKVEILDPEIHVMDLIEATCDVLNVGPTMLDIYGVKQRWFTAKGAGAMGLSF
ncbi:hypothetical protein D3C87_1017570 [compost metagenome]